LSSAIISVNVLTGTDDGLLRDHAILVDDDGVISSVVPNSELAGALPDTVYDGQGATAMPGLIDMHTHAMGGTPDEAKQELDASIVTSQVLRGIANLASAIDNGITTIRDAGAASSGIFRLKAAVDAGQIKGPRMILSGRALTMTGGHGRDSIAVEADGVHGLRRAARAQIGAGAECIKLMASAGASAPCGCIGGLQLGTEEMRAAVEAARRAGLHTLAHAIPVGAVREALAAGVDSIEHGIFLDGDTVAEMKAAGVHYCPTLHVFRRIAVNAAPGRYPTYMVEKAKQCIDAHKVSFKLALSAGIPILAGSDAGNWGWKLGDLADELIEMNQLGMPAISCLASATHTAAKFLGKEDRIGSIRSGRLADILVVAGNPLADLSALRNIAAVFKAGVRVV